MHVLVYLAQTAAYQSDGLEMPSQQPWHREILLSVSVRGMSACTHPAIHVLTRVHFQSWDILHLTHRQHFPQIPLFYSIPPPRPCLLLLLCPHLCLLILHLLLLLLWQVTIALVTSAADASQCRGFHKLCSGIEFKRRRRTRNREKERKK